MDIPSFQGLLVPVLTPFHPDLSVNRAAFLAHCRWLLAQGADGLAVFGTTSEANSLSLAERTELLDFLVGSGIPPERLMPGTGTCAIPDTVRLTGQAVALGCRGVLMLPPFYYKGVSDAGLYAYYSEVIDRVANDRLRLYLYHIPPIAQISLSIPLVGQLLNDFPGIVAGIKDSSGDWSHTQALLSAYPDMAIFPGSENYLLAALRGGGAGCISATANVNPAGIRRVIEHWHSASAEDLQARATQIRDIFQQFPLIPGLKDVVSRLHGDLGWRTVRPPLQTLSSADSGGLGAKLEQAGFTME